MSKTGILLAGIAIAIVLWFVISKGAQALHSGVEVTKQTTGTTDAQVNTQVNSIMNTLNTPEGQ